jgi:hypothetical protein
MKSLANTTKGNIWELEKDNPLGRIKLDSIPMWWFFKPNLILNSLRAPFFNFEEITNNSKKDSARLIKTEIVSNLLKKYILFNEKKKFKIRKKDIKTTNKQKILFLTYSNHIKENKILRLSPILNKLPKKDIEPFILTTDLISNKVNKKINNYKHTIYEYLTEDIFNKAEKTAEQIHKFYKETNKTEFQKYLNQELNFLFSKEILSLTIAYYLACRVLIRKENIKEVVITADTGFLDRALIASLKKDNIPLTIIPHGNPGTIPIETFSDTRLCVKGNFYLKNVKNVNFKGKIRLTGSIDYDKILKFKKPIKKNKRKVLITTSPLVEDNFIEEEKYKEIIKNVIESITKLKNTKIQISLHPRETNIELYKKLAAKHENVEVIKKVDINYLYESLNNSDVVISSGSGSAIEAIILNKPVIYLNLFGKNTPYIQLYKDQKAVIETSQKQLYTTLKRIFEDKKLKESMKRERENFIKDYCYKIDGKSTERIIKEILTSIKDGRKNTRQTGKLGRTAK